MDVFGTFICFKQKGGCYVRDGRNGIGCFVRGGKNGMGCFVQGDKNYMGFLVSGGKTMWDVLSGVSKSSMGCFVPGCFVLHSKPTLYDDTKIKAHDSQIVKAKEILKLSRCWLSYR